MFLSISILSFLPSPLSPLLSSQLILSSLLFSSLLLLSLSSLSLSPLSLSSSPLPSSPLLFLFSPLLSTSLLLCNSPLLVPLFPPFTVSLHGVVSSFLSFSFLFLPVVCCAMVTGMRFLVLWVLVDPGGDVIVQCRPLRPMPACRTQSSMPRSVTSGARSLLSCTHCWMP